MRVCLKPYGAETLFANRILSVAIIRGNAFENLGGHIPKAQRTNIGGIVKSQIDHLGLILAYFGPLGAAFKDSSTTLRRRVLTLFTTSDGC
jgi:hypothetical protein